MKVAVLIVAFNSAAHLQRQIAALEAQTHRDFHVVLLDNASHPEERPCAGPRHGSPDADPQQVVSIPVRTCA